MMHTHQRRARHASNASAVGLLFGLAGLLTPALAGAVLDAQVQAEPASITLCQEGSPALHFGSLEEPGQVRFDLAEALPEGATIHGLEVRVSLSTMSALRIGEDGPNWRIDDHGTWRPFTGRASIDCAPHAATGDCPNGERQLLMDSMQFGPAPAPSWTLHLADPSAQLADQWVQQACLTIDYLHGQPPSPTGPDLGTTLPDLGVVLPDLRVAAEVDASLGEDPSEPSPPPPQPEAPAEQPVLAASESTHCAATPTQSAPWLWLFGLLPLLRPRRRSSGPGARLDEALRCARGGLMEP